MSATYVVLRVPEAQEADDLLRDIRAHEEGEAYVLTPTQENIVGVEVVSAYRDGVPYSPPPECDTCGGELALAADGNGTICVRCCAPASPVPAEVVRQAGVEYETGAGE